MPDANGNLSLDERRDLPGGAVVAWRSQHGLGEQIGTVDWVGPMGGCVILCDETRIGLSDYCRLIHAEPTGFTGPDVRGTEDIPEISPASKASGPQDAPKPEKRLETRVEEKPVAKGQGLPRTKKLRKDKGKPVKDHALWLRAVNAIHDRMEAGAHRYDAVTEVAELPEFASLHITGASYPWWAKRFRDQGLVTRNFVGGTNLSPHDRAAAQLSGLQKCVAMDKAEENNGGGVKPVAESELHDLIESLSHERNVAEATAKALRADLDEARVKLEAKAKPAGITPPPPLGKGSSVSSCKWEFSSKYGCGYVELMASQFGYRVALYAAEPMRFELGELAALAKWADEACKVMDHLETEEESKT